MSKPSFTPGPWKSIRDKEANEIIIRSVKGRKFIASLDLHSLKSGTEENCANAFLIAAAPELLTAYKELLWLVESSKLAECSCGKPREDFVCLVCNARQAVAKAEGRES